MCGKGTSQAGYLVLKQVGQDGYGCLDGFCVLCGDPAAHVGCSRHSHSLYAGLEEVQVGEHSQQGSVAQASLSMLAGQLLQRLQTEAHRSLPPYKVWHVSKWLQRCLCAVLSSQLHLLFLDMETHMYRRAALGCCDYPQKLVIEGGLGISVVPIGQTRLIRENLLLTNYYGQVYPCPLCWEADSICFGMRHMQK